MAILTEIPDIQNGRDSVNAQLIKDTVETAMAANSKSDNAVSMADMASTNASSALSTANDANITSNNANAVALATEQKADTALANSVEAKSTATQANNKASEVWQAYNSGQLQGESGVTVFANGMATFFVQNGRLKIRKPVNTANPFRLENGRLIMTLAREVL